MSVGRIFREAREVRQDSLNNRRNSKYDYEKIGRAKCYSHGAKGFYRYRNESSCKSLEKIAGCKWKEDEKGGFCDLPKENSEKMRKYLNMSKEERKALKAAPPPEEEAEGEAEAALKKKKKSKRRRKYKKRKPTKTKKSKRRSRKHTRKRK